MAVLSRYKYLFVLLVVFIFPSIVYAGESSSNLSMVQQSSEPDITPIKKTTTAGPDATLSGTGVGTLYNGTPIFKSCSNNTTVFTFNNESTTKDTNVRYIFDWGDGTASFATVSYATTSHSYRIGLWNLVYKIEGPNGTSTTKNFLVFVGGTPTVFLGTPAVTDICNPTSLNFPITATRNNPSGTTYKITFSDGSAPQIFSTPPQSITHNFTKSSCGTTSGAFSNAFSATIVAENPCGSSEVVVAPIYVTDPPVADFELPKTNSCVDEEVCLTNTSPKGSIAGSTGCLDPAVIWKISPATGFTLTSGNLGNDFGLSDQSAWNTGTNKICPKFTSPGTYTITMKIGNKCGVSQIVKTICVETPITPEFSLNASQGCTSTEVTTSNTTITTNSCTTPQFNWEVSYTSGFCGTSASYVYTNGTSSTSVSPSFRFDNPGNYTIKLSIANACGLKSVSQEITIKDRAPVINLNDIPDFCGTASFTPIAAVVNCAPPKSPLNYLWTFSGGNPATSTAENPGTITYNSPGTYTVSLNLTNACGVSVTSSKSFNINALPIISNVTFSQSVCSGLQSDLVSFISNDPNTTYSWTATATEGISGFIPSGDLNTLPIQTITTTNATSGKVTYTVIPKLGNCLGTARDYVINVHPAAAFTSQPMSSAVCQGGTPTSLSVAFINGASPSFQWYQNLANDNVNGSLIPGATNATYNPPTNQIGQKFYYCVVNFPSAVCSGITSNTASVSVSAVPSFTIQPQSLQTICVGGTIPAPIFAEYSGGSGTPSFQWYSNTINSNIGGTAILGANTLSYTPPAFGVPGTYYYYLVIGYSTSGCSTLVSDVSRIEVVSDPVVSVQPITTQNVCKDAAPVDLKVTVTGGVGSYFYQWYENTVDNLTSGTLILGATGATYTPSTATIGTKYFYCKITQDAGLNCDVTSATSQLIVVTNPTISNQPISSSVCKDGIASLLSVSYTNGIGAPGYQWYVNTIDDTSSGLLIAGATNSTFNPSTSTVGTYYYYCVISFPSSTCSSITSATATLSVNAIPAINIQPTPTQNMCIGGSLPTPLSVNYTGGVGVPSYQWYSNTVNSTIGGSLIAGATNSNYTPPAFTLNQSYYYFVTLTFTGSGCNSVTSDVATVVVYNDPTITVNPLATQTVCQNSNSTNLIVAATGGVGIYFYQWYKNSVNNTTSGTLISGETGSTYTPLTNTVETSFYYCVITQAAGLGCEVVSQTAEVKVILPPTFTSQPMSSSVCQGGAPAILTVNYINGVGIPSYQWYSNIIDNNTGGIQIAGETNPTYSPSSLVLGTTYYYCTINLSAGTCSTLTSNTATVTVNQVPAITTQPVITQNICVGGTIATPLTINFAGGAGAITYQWYLNTVNSNIGGSLILGATSLNYTPPAFTSSGTNYYYLVVTFDGSGCNTLTSNTAEIVVADDPVVNSQPLSSQTLCQNSTPTDLTVSASGGLGGFLYQWYVKDDLAQPIGNIVAGATNSTYTPLTTAIGKKYYYCQITQPVGLSCDAKSDIAEVDIVPSPSINSQPVSTTYCEGATSIPLSVSYINGVGTPSYQWYSNVINSVTYLNPIAGETNASFTPPVSSPGTIYYYCQIILSSGSCTNLTTDIAQITVNKNPVIADKATTICSGETFTITPTNLSGDYVPVGTTYSWSFPTFSPAGSIAGASVQNIPQNSISQTLTNLALTNATATYTVTPISGSCLGTPFKVVVTVNPAININTTVNAITCFGANDGTIKSVISGGIPFGFGAPYTVSWTGPNGFTSTATDLNGLLAGTYTLTVTDAFSCSVTRNYTIIEPQLISIAVNNEKDIPCYGASNGEIALSITGGTPPYKYNWTKNTVAYATTEDLTNLGPGVYEVTVTDLYNCAPKTASFTITEPALLGVNLVSQTNVLCFGDASGAITVNVFGGTQIEKSPGVFDYNYLWIGTNGFSSNNKNLLNIPAGIYNLVVTDLMGCSKSLTVNITQTPEISIVPTLTPITCYGANNASISLAISGGNAPYQTQWSNLGTGFFQNNLAAGNYSINVTDNLGCQKSITVNVPEAPIFTINPTIKHISCFGASNGSINLNFIGGKAPVSVVWSDSPTTSTVRTNLGPGTYTVAISDGAPCFINNSFTILEPQLLVLSANVRNASDCTTANSGSIDLLVAGGTAPYNYTWSTGATTEDITNLVAGNYTVTVIDANNCVQTANYVITRPLPIEISVTTLDGYNCSTQKTIKTCTAKVTEGVPPYKLTWSRGTTSGVNNEIIETTQSGVVDLQVEDALGCIKIMSFNVEIKKLGIDYVVEDCNAHKFRFNALTLNIQDNFTYLWDFGDGSSSTAKSPLHVFANSGNYDLQLTVFGNSCTSIFKQTITVEEQPQITLDREPKICIGDSVVLHALGAISYRWNNGTTADSILIKQTGLYSVIGRTKDGCLDTLNFIVNYYDSKNYSIQSDKTEITTDGATVNFWSEAIPFSNYSWDFGDGNTSDGFNVSHIYDPKEAGHFDVKLRVINPNGCIENASKRIWIKNNSTVNTFTPNGDGENDLFMKDWRIKIYNRNGIVLYEGKDGWDGKYKGKDVAIGTYFYVVYYETEKGTQTRTDYVTLIRKL